jgi:hypothetical protein
MLGKSYLLLDAYKMSGKLKGRYTASIGLSLNETLSA